MEASVKASCNWTRSGGCDFATAIQTKITHEDIFIRPELDEILGEEHAILLNFPGSVQPTEACELELDVFPRYKIESLTVVSSASKVELFLGPQKQYAETVCGTLIEEDTDEDLGGAVVELLCYRYDIEIQKSGIVNLTLKLLPITPEICIYGILLQLAPNPNGVTTLLPSAINLENVQQMLGSSTISPNSEKCKLFMQMAYQSGKQKQTHSLQQHHMLHEVKSDVAGNDSSSATLDGILKSHIDTRLVELEARVNVRLDAIAAEQTTKLDRILEILANNQNF